MLFPENTEHKMTEKHKETKKLDFSWDQAVNHSSPSQSELIQLHSFYVNMQMRKKN